MRSERINGMWAALNEETKKLKGRSEQHIARKVFHVSGVALLIFLYHILERQTGLMILGTVLAVFLPLDFLRRNVPAINNLALSMAGGIMRKEEQGAFTGVSYLLLGSFIVIFLFPVEVVTLALIMLGLGDPISSIVGTKYGKDKIIGNKSLQGSMACMIVCTLCAAIYFMKFGIMTERIVLVSLIAGIIGAISELVPIGKLDDNMTFPILSSTMLYGLFLLFGGF